MLSRSFDENSKLYTKNTENILQDVSKLIESTNKLLEYINLRVLSDFNVLVDTGEQYLHGVVIIDKKMNGICSYAINIDKIIGDGWNARADGHICYGGSHGTTGVNNTITRVRYCLIGHKCIIMDIRVREPSLSYYSWAGSFVVKHSHYANIALTYKFANSSKWRTHMLKVFLVEDEYVVREGIKNNVAWNEHGFIFCGEAGDGEYAYTLIRQLRPDIIITDIKMPFMNGLELSRLVKKDYPDIKIIILSGYEEFDLAKEAINIGVEEYLLKPINADVLIHAIEEVAKKILTERQEKENLLKFKLEMKENEIETKRNYFNELISSQQPLSNKLEKGRQLGIDLSAVYYNIVLFKVARVEHGSEEFSNRLLLIHSELNKYFESENILCFERHLEGMALLLKADSMEELEQKKENYIADIEKIIKKYDKVTYFGGIGCVVNRLSELFLSFEEASRAFAYRFIKEESQFIEADKLFELNMKDDNPWVEMSYKDYLDKEIVEKFLCNGELGEVNFFVEEYFKNFALAGEKSMMFRQYVIIDMYFTAANFIDKISEGEEAIQAKKSLHRLQDIKSIVIKFEHTLSYIKELFDQVIRYRNEMATKRFSNIIKETKAYIQKNYCDEEISLNTVALYVNISPSYLSTVFSQETGQTFVKYLTDLRMNKAKELLMCTNKRSNEISSEVGYKDPHYFSYLFKKTQGCSPLQFRMNKSRDKRDTD